MVGGSLVSVAGCLVGRAGVVDAEGRGVVIYVIVFAVIVAFVTWIVCSEYIKATRR